MHTNTILSMRHAWPQKVPEAAGDALGKERKDCGLGVGTKTKVCVVSVVGTKTKVSPLSMLPSTCDRPYLLLNKGHSF